MKKVNTTTLLFAAFAFFFVSTLVLLYLNYFVPKTLPKTQTGILAIPTSAPIIDSSSDWKIYKNSTYGFSIQYPQNLFASIPNGYPDTAFIDISSINFPEASEGPVSPIKFMVLPGTLTSQANSLKEYNFKDFFQKSINLGGKTATQIGGIIQTDVPIITGKKLVQTIFQITNDNILVLEYININEKVVSEDLYSQILSTFKFTSANPTSNLTTYENKELGFSFQYDATKHLLQTNRNTQDAINSSKKYYNFDLNPTFFTLWKGKNAVQLDSELTMHFNPNQIFNIRIIDNISISPRDYVAKLCEPEYGPDYLTSSGFKRTVLGNIVMYSFNSGGIGNGTYNHVFFDNDKIFSFETSEPENTFETNPEFSQILSTFKFL